MGTTTNLALRYPEASDPPAGMTQIKNLAEDVDALADSGNLIRSAGKSIIAAAQSRTNTAYGELGTPDRVSGIVLPTDGLIFVAYQALWNSLNNGAGRAAIFIGTNQLKVALDDAAAGIQETTTGGGAAYFHKLSSIQAGLLGTSGANSAHTTDVVTGQAVVASDGAHSGGICVIFAAAGTYDISVQFKATSGPVTAKERKLWVWSMAFS